MQGSGRERGCPKRKAEEQAAESAHAKKLIDPRLEVNAVAVLPGRGK